MSIYFTDQIEITPINRDVNFRNETEGTPFYSEAYVEDKTEIKYGPDGQPLKPVMFIGLPINTSIVKGDFIEITKLHGKTIEQKSKIIDTSENLIGLWRLDEGKGIVALDESQYKNHAILKGTTPTWIDGKSLKAVNLPGVDERINCGNLTPLDQLGNGSFWLSFWMNSKDTVPLNYSMLFSKYALPNQLYLASNGTVNRLIFTYSKVTGVVLQLFSAATMPFDTIWNHIVLEINRTTDKALLYMNKVKDATEIDISALPADASFAADILWGRRSDGQPYEGAFDELRIYIGEPTQTDINFLHDNPGAPLKSTTRIRNLRRKVKRVNEVGSFGMSHIEVLV